MLGKLSLNLLKSNSKASKMLDLLRFLSALTVFLFHFYVPLPGYQAVMVFFVLSGYFISSSVFKVMKVKKWSWGDYLLKRITRLWIVLLPALFLTYIWAKIQLGLFGEDLSPPNLKISHYINWELLFGNIFFLQGIIVKGSFGLNGPLWSLTYEMWYYILFPCILLIFQSNKKVVKVIYLLLSIGISIFLGTKIMEYFLIWMLGAIIPIIKPLNIEKKYLKTVILICSGLLAIISLQYAIGSSYFFDMRVGLTFSLLTYFFISFYNFESTNGKVNIPKYLAGFSYTLYLTHYPLANFILTWRLSNLWPFVGNPLFFKAILAILVFGYAWLIGILTEKHTEKLRRFVSKMIFRNKIKTLKNNTISHNIQ